MKTKIILILIALLSISGAFEDGCKEEEEPKPDYITVTVKAQGYIYLKNNTTQNISCDEFEFLGQDVKIAVIKDQGETFTYYSGSWSQCYFEQPETATFKLYREQRIEVQAYYEEVRGGYTQIRAVALLFWDDVYPNTDFGESYSWKPEITGYWLYN